MSAKLIPLSDIVKKAKVDGKTARRKLRAAHVKPVKDNHRYAFPPRTVPKIVKLLRA